MDLEPYFGSSWTMLMENNLLPREQGWMAWKDQLEELSLMWRVIIASVNPCKQSYVILLLQMKSDTDPRRRRGIEPCFLCSLPPSPAAPGKGSSTVFLELTIHFLPKWTSMKAWVPGLSKSTSLGHAISSSSLTSTWQCGLHLSELQFISVGKRGVCTRFFFFFKEVCPLCLLQNTFVTFAVDEGHLEYYLPYICLYNKINLFSIPYSNIYLGYELSSIICEIQSLMC